MIHLLAAFLAWPLWAQSMDVYVPKTAAPKPSPILLFLHGGGWVSGHKEEYKDLGEKLAANGLCAGIVEYHLAPMAMHPQPVRDLDAALSSLQLPASCDSQQIYLMGHSAGAHTIATWAAEHQDPNVRGFIGIEGIYDIPDLVKLRPMYEAQFIRAEFGPATNWAAASPTRLEPKNKTPWLLVHSRGDELVERAQATNFEKHLKALGVPVEYFQLQSENHFGAVTGLLGFNSPLLAKILAFIHERASSTEHKTSPSNAK